MLAGAVQLNKEDVPPPQALPETPTAAATPQAGSEMLTTTAATTPTQGTLAQPPPSPGKRGRRLKKPVVTATSLRRSKRQACSRLKHLTAE